MYIEQVKDTAFGTDFGGDFQEFIESFTSESISLDDIYSRSDLDKLLAQRKDFLQLEYADHDVSFINADGHEQQVHYEEALIALFAIAVECRLVGSADLTKAYGSKQVKLVLSDDELRELSDAIGDIYHHPDAFILFEFLIDEQSRQEVLGDIAKLLKLAEQALS